VTRVQVLDFLFLSLPLRGSASAVRDARRGEDERGRKMSVRRRAGGARKMKAFSRVENMTSVAAFDKAMKKKDQLLLIEFVSVR